MKDQLSITFTLINVSPKILKSLFCRYVGGVPTAVDLIPGTRGSTAVDLIPGSRVYLIVSPLNTVKALLKCLFHPAFLARVVSWLAFVCRHFHGL